MTLAEALEMNALKGAGGGWRTVETHIDKSEGMVRMTMTDSGSGRILYSARYPPETAREMAFNLSLRALQLEDE